MKWSYTIQGTDNPLIAVDLLEANKIVAFQGEAKLVRSIVRKVGTSRAATRTIMHPKDGEIAIIWLATEGKR